MGVDSIFGQGSTFKLRLPLGYGHLPRQYLVNPNAPQSKLSSRLDEYGLNRSEDISTFGSAPSTVQTGATSQAGTKSESAAGTDDSPETTVAKSDLWPPLLFGERQRARILLADDNADLRTFITSILGKYADVREAVDGQAAWELLQTHPFDLVLSDIMVCSCLAILLMRMLRLSKDA
jgi:PleD family two-component response regulator